MSSYSNFIKDFPKRCLDILNTYEEHARYIDLEVTFMLAIATAGFVIPFERLRPRSGDLAHPSGDILKFKKARDKFEKILNIPFVHSVLWNGDVSSWIFAKKLKNIQRGPDLWEELNNPKPLSIKKQMSSVLNHLRNALAHGNIFTKGNPIKLIIFLSRCCEYVDGQCKPIDKYDMLAVSPEDFRKFLIDWFNFLASLPIPSGIIQESIMDLPGYSA